MRDDDLAGRTIAGRYDILEALGSGGMGAVYRARDRELDELIAFKVIRGSGPGTLDRFRREVKLARRVTHRNVARTFELGRADGITFCTMELVEGESLRHRLAREQCIAESEAVAIARELCEGLAAAHTAGVIHRDIKPDNVLIAYDGRVVLADFGVASATLADPGEVAGTFAYMAPEQRRGEAPTPATDIYALGLVLFEMVTGARAVHDASTDIEGATHATPHLALDRCGRELAHVISRATELEPARRIATATELGKLLAALTHAQPSPPPIGVAVGFAVRTVIVLPPRGTHGNQHLVLALHEEVLARLGRVPRLRAIPRASATDEPADSVVELVATDAVTATITRPANAPMVMRLPLAVRELDASADAIANAVANAVEPRGRQLPEHEAEAIELVLAARERLQRGLGHSAEALALIERANVLLPDDPRVFAALAFCEVRNAFLFTAASEERLARGRKLVRAALAAGPDRVESHLAAGHFELHAGRCVLAARHFRDAIARAPYSAEAHEYLGRMLLEAGFLDIGLARVEDALAMAPAQSVVRWDVARAWALEGRWDDYDRVVDDLVAADADRWLMRVRGAWWRRDDARLARIRGERALPLSNVPLAVAEIADAILERSWPARRDTIVARALTASASSRRRAFDAQLGAEAAGYFGDAVTCMMLLERVAAEGCFDLHWLDRCRMLDVVRGPQLATIRDQFAGRADAILDAMYRDPDVIDDAETTNLR